MTDPVDLDRLDALHAAATPARWSVKHNTKHKKSKVYAGTNQRAVFDGRLLLGQHEDAELAVALHNAWPAISAELRRLRAELRRMAEWYDAIADTIPGDAAGPHFGVVEWVRQLVANARALAIEELEALRGHFGTLLFSTKFDHQRAVEACDRFIAALRAGDAAKEAT